jgi:hypothetical protein
MRQDLDSGRNHCIQPQTIVQSGLPESACKSNGTSMPTHNANTCVPCQFFEAFGVTGAHNVNALNSEGLQCQH